MTAPFFVAVDTAWCKGGVRNQKLAEVEMLVGGQPATPALW